MQITKSGNMLQFRFVVKPGADKDESQIPTVQAMGAMLSSVVFGGAPLEVDLCDDHFQTLRGPRDRRQMTGSPERSILVPDRVRKEGPFSCSTDSRSREPSATAFPVALRREPAR